MRAVLYRKGDGRCARCGGELLLVILASGVRTDTAPGGHLVLTSLCGQCATPEELAYVDRSGDCPGCGIAMRFSNRDAITTRWVACSTRCYQRAWRRSRRMKKRTCEVCRETFDTARTDARFCSNACRQWAFRLRHATGPTDTAAVLLWADGSKVGS